MKANKIKRNILNVLMVLVMLMAISLTACSSNKSDVDSTKEETTEVKEEVAELEPTAEPTLKPTPEPTSEPTPVPTPDTESTLPGIEWIQTFDGIIDEPKLVVFNDETNKKIIIEDSNQEVEFYDNDTLAVYIPKGRGNVVTNDYISGSYEKIEYYDNIVTLSKIPSIISRGGYSSARVVDIEFDGEPMALYCYLKLMGNP